MVTLLWIIGFYIGNVLLGRYLNKVSNRLDGGNVRAVGIWFVPIFGPLLIGYFVIRTIFDKNEFKWVRWFTGVDWENENKNR